MGVECAMEKLRRRAKRRFYAARQLKRAEQMVRGWFLHFDPEKRDEYVYTMARKRRDSMKGCSCFGCGNPRRNANNTSDRLTRAELRADDAFRDMTLDVEEREHVVSVDVS